MPLTYGSSVLNLSFNVSFGSAQTLRQAPVASSSGYVIYTTSSGDCLEYNTASNKVFQEIPGGCFTNEDPFFTHFLPAIGT